MAPSGSRLAVSAETPRDELVAAVRAWIAEYVPAAWREAAAGGTRAIRAVRSRADYEAWYPVFGSSGLVAPTWPVAYEGLDLPPASARLVEAELRPVQPRAGSTRWASTTRHPHSSPTAPRSSGCASCRRSCGPRRSGASSSASPAPAPTSRRCRRGRCCDGDEWVVTGQKVWTTWGFAADFAVLLARTDPDVPKRNGLTYFLIDLHQPGVDIRPLRHITGEVDFCEVFLDGARIPDTQRVGGVNDGWRIAGATLSGERQMVSGSGSGGVDRIGGGGIASLIALARRISAEGRPGGWDDPVVRQELMAALLRGRHPRLDELAGAGAAAGRAGAGRGEFGGQGRVGIAEPAHPDAGDRPARRVRDRLGRRRMARITRDALPYEVKGMLRSRANTIEGGTTEVNKNILAERVLGLPREPDPWHGKAWREVPA